MRSDAAAFTSLNFLKQLPKPDPDPGPIPPDPDPFPTPSEPIPSSQNFRPTRPPIQLHYNQPTISHCHTPSCDDAFVPAYPEERVRVYEHTAATSFAQEQYPYMVWE